MIDRRRKNILELMDRSITAGIRPVDGASAAAFRIAFGLLGLAGVIRFFAYGWISDIYIEPAHHFAYFGFGWVQPWPGWGMYLHFALMGLFSLGIALGYKYRLCAALFFATFTYVELLDKTTYLNHYYLVSLLSFLMIFMPLDRVASVDAYRRRTPAVWTVPVWVIWTLRAQLAAVYLFAGIAKLNPDWLWEGRPLRIWLHQNPDLLFLAPWAGEVWVAYLVSWGGLLFDLTIVGWLLWPRSRPIAYLAVLVFHVLTWRLFPIGIFPWVMLAAALIFFDPDWPRQVCRRVAASGPMAWLERKRGFDSTPPSGRLPESSFTPRVSAGRRWAALALLLFALVQVVMPLRHYAYPGNVRWNEEGYRFSWRVLLSEKTGFARFWVRDADTGRTWLVSPGEYLTPLQRERMPLQPDMVLETAHIITEDFARRGLGRVQVYAEVFVAFNGYPSRRLVDPKVDLAEVRQGIGPKGWLLSREGDRAVGKRPS